jgi:hypothetical protein
MHILGILFICLFLGAFASLGDIVGAWLFDRRRGA